MKKYIELSNVYRTYSNGKVKTNALRKVNLIINKGEILVILGPSGSGKTTLLNCISGLDKPTKGRIKIYKDYISRYNEKTLTKFRRKNLGFIFQTYNLLENLNVKQNVAIGASLSKKKVNIDKILEIVDMLPHKNKYMDELSGGEQQRVSIARALAKSPDIMFCDEPTGALDEKMGKRILTLIQKINKKYKTTVIIVTHNPSIGEIANTVLKMKSGQIVETHKNVKTKKANEIGWA